MRPSGGNSPLDLNNFPDDYSSRDNGKQILEDISSPGGGCSSRKKKSGGKDGKEECGKVYECRFCSLKFCKSQALGGHMNRHRQERETETLNQARQLVFRSDHNLAAQPPPHLGCCQPIGGGGYHPSGNMGDPTVPLRFPRYFSASSSSTHIPPPPPPPQPYLYASPPSRAAPVSFPHDYYVGHVLGSSSSHGLPSYAAGGAADSGSYTCIGAPVGQAVGVVGLGSKDSGTVAVQQQQEESAAGGLNWGRAAYNNNNGNNSSSSAAGGGGHHHRLDHPGSAINRFQDGF